MNDNRIQTDTLEDKIKLRLHEIGIENNVMILYAAEAGSRAWGFESTDSDYDIRFVYIPYPRYYYELEGQRDVIEYKIDENLFDINGWELRKALQQSVRSNPTLLEWLHSPTVYYKHPLVFDAFRELVLKNVRPTKLHYHYYSMASRNYKEDIQGKALVKYKKYLYAIRPLLATIFIHQFPGSVPPVNFMELLLQVRNIGRWDPIFENNVFEGHIGHLLSMKKEGKESDIQPRIPYLNEWIERQLIQYRKVSMPDDKEMLSNELTEPMMGIIKDAWRVRY